MSVDTQSELASFHEFIGHQLGSIDRKMSPEEALDLWRLQHPPETEDAETVAALREAINDFKAGDRGVPMDEFKQEFRKRHKLGQGE